jgi:2-succinyl-5-enolpyruvyl-6-hydroxy-3-cyclohexene-1-carboxylate synthase
LRDLNRNLTWAWALVDELARAGVRYACISPGSRSAPLAVAFASHPGVEDRSHLDERSAAFFALGLARATRTPVAVVCTSGTAAANYLPAVMEADQSRVPLVLLTADRPPEHRDCGAGQTVDQIKLYGSFVRFFAEVTPPTLEAASMRHLRALACRAVAESVGNPAGAVHLNVPLREPLAPVEVAEDVRAVSALESLSRKGREREPMTSVRSADPPGLPASDVERLALAVASEERGWIVVGPLDAEPEEASALARLATATGWPLFAEPLSQVRSGRHDRRLLVDAHDAVLRVPDFVEKHVPAVVLRFGAMPTSKPYRQWLEAHPEITQFVVDPCGWSDPTSLAAEMLRSDPVVFARALTRRLEAGAGRGRNAFTERWVAAGRRARHALDACLRGSRGLSEPGVARVLAEVLPDPATLYVGNSMPVRDVDQFWPTGDRTLRIFANRGVSGIDGTISCAFGTAAAGRSPLIVLTGDLALLHSWTGLLDARGGGISATVVVLDNDGGGIFHLLPVASTVEADLFEQHFGTPHGIDLRYAVEAFGFDSRVVTTPKDLEAAVADSIRRPGVQFVMVRTDRDANGLLHGELNEAVAQALGSPEEG